MQEGVSLLIAEVDSMPRATGFYRDLLGFPLEYASEHWSTIGLGNGLRLGLHPPFGVRSEPDAIKPGWVVAFRTPDIQALRQRLEEAGVRILGDYHETPGGVILEFADPDGHRLQAMQEGIRLEDLP